MASTHASTHASPVGGGATTGGSPKTRPKSQRLFRTARDMQQPLPETWQELELNKHTYEKAIEGGRGR